MCSQVINGSCDLPFAGVMSDEEQSTLVKEAAYEDYCKGRVNGTSSRMLGCDSGLPGVLAVRGRLRRPPGEEEVAFIASVVSTTQQPELQHRLYFAYVRVPKVKYTLFMW